MAYYKDLREYIEALDTNGKLVRIKKEINKDTELHPLVRWQFRGLPEKERKAFIFEKTVDAKGRINIPATYRNQLEEEPNNVFHVMLGPNENLFVYPQEVFVHIATKLEEKYGSLSTDDEERRYFLETMASAQPSRCDQQGRIIVPKEHLEYAKVDKEVLIIGAVNKFEFWNPNLYEHFLKTSKNSSKERVKLFGRADRS